MSKKIVRMSSDYAQEIAKLVKKMPVEQAVQVYNFVRFLSSQPAHTLPLVEDDDDWLDDSEEDMQAEDEVWDKVYRRHQAKFATLAEAARAEIAADTSQPMFDEQGNFVSDELKNDP